MQQGRRTDAVAYWCVVMAHELAHNLVADHSAQHSYYTESMVIQYFGRIAAKIAGQQRGDGQASLLEDPLKRDQGVDAERLSLD